MGSGEEAVPPPQKIFENFIPKSCILVQNFFLVLRCIRSIGGGADAPLESATDTKSTYGVQSDKTL